MDILKAIETLNAAGLLTWKNDNADGTSAVATLKHVSLNTDHETVRLVFTRGNGLALEIVPATSPLVRCETVYELKDPTLIERLNGEAAGA